MVFDLPLFSKGELALLDKDQQIEAPQSNAKLEENTLSKIEEALVWLNQCKTSAKKALGANSTGQTSNFMKANLKTKTGELISLQSNSKSSRSLAQVTFSRSKLYLPLWATVLWSNAIKKYNICFFKM